MISFVCWKWQRPGYDRVFEAGYVNVLRSMIERHYTKPHRLICVTDEPQGLDPRIHVVPTPVRFDELKAASPRFPSCYRRLWNFSPRARAVFGDRIVALDIDVVITGEIVTMLEREENFVAWTDEAFGWNKIAGGLYMLKTGSMPQVWTRFDPARSPAIAAAAGCSGSDQGWMSYMLWPAPGSFSRLDGAWSIKWMEPGTLAPQARIVSTAGALKPWSAELQRKYPWIKEFWR